MTPPNPSPDERAEAVVKAWSAAVRNGGSIKELGQLIAAAIRESVQAERDRCAKVAEQPVHMGPTTADFRIGVAIARRIRSLAERSRDG